MSRPIEDYALIGDGQTASLLSRDGSIDWLGWPRFDDDACFAALLGTLENGCWSLAPAGQVTANRRRCQEGTLVVENEVETGSRAVRLIDVMPMRESRTSSLVRIVEGVRGTVATRLESRLRFDDGALPPWSEREGESVVAKISPDPVVLRAPVPIDVHDDFIRGPYYCQAEELFHVHGKHGVDPNASWHRFLADPLASSQPYAPVSPR